MHDVVVIGGGVNGLVAAAALARLKHSVVLVEARPVIGGAAITTEFAPGFRAPTLSHALGPISADVVRGLRLDRSDLQILTPDPVLTSLGAGGRLVTFHRDPVLTAASISRHSQADAGRWRAFLQSAHRLSGVVAELNRQPPPPIDRIRAADAWRLLKAGRRARALTRRERADLVRWMPMAVADIVGDWFESDLVQAAIAARAVFGHLAGPWSAGTGMMLLQRLAEDPMPVGGGVTARGGPGAVSHAIAKIAEQRGVRIRTSAHVTRIATRSSGVVSVVLDDGEEIGARAVVSAIDPRQTFLSLIDPAELPPTFRMRVQQIRARGVTAKINLALSALPDIPALHGDAVPLQGRFLIAPDIDYLERAFDAAKYGGLSPEPWLEVSLPTVADPSLAPASAHVMSIYVHYAPHALRDGSWADSRERLFRAALGVLLPHMPALESLIVEREILTPDDLERRWGLSGGHIFHGEQTMDQLWAARPLLGWGGYRTPIDGLFLAGAGTHPGGGLTGASGWIAAQAIARDLKKRPRT